jgi:protein phosphatase
MPLAQTGAVLDAPPAEAAALVAAFLRVTEADFAERQRLAQFLISYLREGATAMPDPIHPVPPALPGPPALPVPFASRASQSSSAAGPVGLPLAVRYAAASDIGRIRQRNQDVGYAGPQLLAVADGFGPGGEQASAAAIDALRPLESPAHGALTGSGESADAVPADLLNLLSDAVSAAGASVRSIAESEPDLAGSGATLTAMLLSGSRLALVHIGDSRAYLFRDGGLFQITHDHSVTQSMIDAGRLTPEEATSHPQRSLLLRAVGASAAELARAGLAEEHARLAGTPDLSLLDALPGDRYLITSDGLTNVVPDSVIRQTLSATDLSPAVIIQRLIALANEAGGPDNIALALADIVPAPA